MVIQTISRIYIFLCQLVEVPDININNSFCLVVNNFSKLLFYINMFCLNFKILQKSSFFRYNVLTGGPNSACKLFISNF